MTIHAGRASRLAALALAAAALALLGMLCPLAGKAKAANPPTVVSLTFDDSTAHEYTNVLPALQQAGLHGTFYTITGYIGVNPAYMTLPQLQAIGSAGNEITGHTVLHPDLTQLSSGEAAREICNSRNTLLDWGFQPTNFAYPYSAYNSTVEGIAQQCGYNSARIDEDLQGVNGDCNGCDVSETIPPADPYAIRTPGSVKDTWTLSDLEGLVTGAEAQGGGWLPLTFHHICDNDCNLYSMSTANFSA